MKFRELMALWVENKKHYIKRSSISAYTLLLQNHILPEFGDDETIDEYKAQDFVLKKVEGNLGHKTVKDIMIVLKMVLKFGAKRGLFEYKPFEIIYPTESKSQKLEVLTRAQHKELLEHVKDNFTFRGLGVLICLSTGIRIGEVCALIWDDIDEINEVIIIRRTIQRIYSIDTSGKWKTELILDSPKTQSSNREIPMSRDLLNIIKPLKKIVNPSYYVLTNEMKPTEPRTYRSWYMDLMKELELPILKFHGLRHTFATRCIESNCDIKTVSVILGHAKVGTTLDLYTHPNNEQKKKAIDQMFKKL